MLHLLYWSLICLRYLSQAPGLPTYICINMVVLSFVFVQVHYFCPREIVLTGTV